MSNKGVSVGVEITGTAKGFKAASSDAARASAELSRKARAHSKEMEESFKKVTIAAAKIGGAILVAKQAFDLYAKAMNTTEGSADKLEEQMGMLGGAVQGAMTTLFSGDWATLITNISTTAEATRDLVKANDELSQAKARNAIAKGDLEMLLNAAKIAAAEETDNRKKKSYLEDAVGYQKQITLITVEELKKQSQATEDYYKKVFGGDEDYWNYVKNNIVTVAKNYDQLYSNLEGYKLRLEQLNAKELNTFGGLTDAETEESHQLKLTLFLLEDYIKLQDKLSKKGQFEEFLNGLGAIRTATAQGDQDILRLTKQITTLGTAINKVDFSRVTGLSKASTSRLSAGSLSNYSSPNTLAGPPAPVDDLTKAGLGAQSFNDKLADELKIVNTLDAAFASFFSNTDGGFDKMAQSFIGAIEQMAAQMAAKAAIFAIMSVLFPGSAIVTKGLGSLLKGVFGLAEGGIASGPTLANVGEYSGAKSNPEVIAPLSKLKGMLGDVGTGGGTVLVKFQNGSLEGYMSYQNRKANSYR